MLFPKVVFLITHYRPFSYIISIIGCIKTETRFDLFFWFGFDFDFHECCSNTTFQNVCFYRTFTIVNVLNTSDNRFCIIWLILKNSKIIILKILHGNDHFTSGYVITRFSGSIDFEKFESWWKWQVVGSPFTSPQVCKIGWA